MKWITTMETASWQWCLADPTGRKLIKFKSNITLFLPAVYRIHLTVGSRNDKSIPQILPSFSMEIHLVKKYNFIWLMYGRSCIHKNFLEIFLSFLRFQNFLDYRSNMKSKQDAITIWNTTNVHIYIFISLYMHTIMHAYIFNKMLCV